MPRKSEYSSLENVLQEMYNAGGRLIDSSPMYGRSEKVIGEITNDMENGNGFFYATKVWTTGEAGGHQANGIIVEKMKRKVMDLMQIHNLTDWKTHLETLRTWKDEGRIRYIGITHYTDHMHDELQRIISKEKIDFVQFNYSIFSRNAEKRLLPAAHEHGVAVLINRPFGEGSIFSKVKGKSLPAWGNELNVANWAAFFLKYIISHPAVTCVIPATGDPVHASQNFNAASGNLPDEGTRRKMVEYVSAFV